MEEKLKDLKTIIKEKRFEIIIEKQKKEEKKPNTVY